MGSCAPTLVRLGKEFDDRFPDRDKASEGCCASSAHSMQNPTSDHEPGPDGYCAARDIDEDLTPNGPGPDDLLWYAWFIYNNPTRFYLVKYLIYEGKIWYPAPGARPRGIYTYTGVNAHKQHLHISIHRRFVNASVTWLPSEGVPMEFTNEDRRMLAEIHAKVGDVHNALLNDADPRPLGKKITETRSMFDSTSVVGEMRRGIRGIAAKVDAHVADADE